MCTNAEKTIQELFTPVDTSIVSILGALNITSSTAGQGILTGLNEIKNDLATWQSGTPAQETIQVIGDVAAALQAIPLVPPNIQVLIGVALAGLQGIIGALSGNGPTPANTSTPQFTANVMARTLQNVKTTAPDFRYHKGIFSKSPASQYQQYWNEKCDANGLADLKLGPAAPSPVPPPAS